MRTLLVDDEPLAREGLRLMLRSHPDVEIVGEAASGAEALERIAAIRPELLLLDIQMPELDGLSLIASLPEDRPLAVIFVTAHSAHAVEAFDLHALHYLLKPVDDDKLAAAIDRARAHLRREPPASPGRIPIRDRGRIVYLPIDEIDWIEAADYYVEIHAGGRTLLHRERLSTLARTVGEGFVRIHRSRLVNRKRIRELRREGSERLVILEDGTALGVARSCREALVPHPIVN